MTPSPESKSMLSISPSANNDNKAYTPIYIRANYNFSNNISVILSLFLSGFKTGSVIKIEVDCGLAYI